MRGVSRRSRTWGGLAGGRSGRRSRGPAASTRRPCASGRRSPRPSRRRAAARAGRSRTRANRQLRICPSAVSRTRSHAPQKGRVTERDHPDAGRAAIDEEASRRGRRRAPFGVRGGLERGGQRLEDVAGGDHLGSLPAVLGVERHLLDEPQLVPALKAVPQQLGCLVSLSPRISTALTLTGVSPADVAAARPASTSASRSRRVSFLKISGRNVSSETLIRSSPASRSARRRRSRPIPLVVSEISGRGVKEAVAAMMPPGRGGAAARRR